MTGPLHASMHFVQAENVRLKSENRDLRETINQLNTVLDALRALQELSTSIDANTNALGLLDHILQSALASIGATDGSLLLVDEEKKELAFVVVHGAVRESLPGYRIPIGKGIVGWVAQHAQAVVVPNVRRDKRFSPEVDQNFQFHTQSLLCVPLVYDERVLGIINAVNKADGEDFNDSDLTLLGIVAQVAATAIQKIETVST